MAQSKTSWFTQKKSRSNWCSTTWWKPSCREHSTSMEGRGAYVSALACQISRNRIDSTWESKVTWSWKRGIAYFVHLSRHAPHKLKKILKRDNLKMSLKWKLTIWKRKTSTTTRLRAVASKEMILTYKTRLQHSIIVFTTSTWTSQAQICTIAKWDSLMRIL